MTLMEPSAYMVSEPGQPFTFDEMISHLKAQRIAAYKLPERLEPIEKLPMVADGQKVDKKRLQKEIARKLGTEGKV